MNASVEPTPAAVFQIPSTGFQKKRSAICADTLAPERRPLPYSEFGRDQTHGIAQWSGNTLLAHSSGRGWKNLYATLATVNSWSGTLAPVQNYCVAFCLNRPARLRRVVSGEPDTGTTVVLPRQFLVIPAHQSSQWQREGSSEMLMLYLHHDMLEQTGSEIFNRDRVQIAPRLGATDPLLEQLALAVLTTMEHPDPLATNLYVDSLAQALAAQLVRAHSKQLGLVERAGNCNVPGFRRLRDFIEASLDQDLSLAVLAREASVSVHMLPRVFRQHFGTTPHQYLLGRRLARARALLADTDLPIAEVSLETGFSSQSHFASTFKKCTGITPHTYRQN